MGVVASAPNPQPYRWQTCMRTRAYRVSLTVTLINCLALGGCGFFSGEQIVYATCDHGVEFVGYRQRDAHSAVFRAVHIVNPGGGPIHPATPITVLWADQR